MIVVAEILEGDLGCGRKTSGKCCFRSKGKVLEGSNGLRWGGIQTVCCVVVE